MRISRLFVHRMAIGWVDLEGDGWGDIFARAVDGNHLSSPVGLADIQWNGCAWSVKTIKHRRPFSQDRVRLISGRNSPDYSLGISDPRADIAATGRAVLAIWNARVNASLDEHDEIRLIVLIRNWQAREFVVFEDDLHRFPPDDYVWQLNQRGNLEGYEGATGEHRFTWQPHGSQLTILRSVPASARRFSIAETVPIVDPDYVLAWARFKEDWVVLHA